MLIAPGVLFYYDVTPKTAALLLGGAALAAWLVVRGRPYLRSLSRERHGRWFCGLVAAQAVSLAFATAFSSNPMVSLAGGTWRRFGAIPHICVLVCALAAASLAAGGMGRVRRMLAAVSLAGSVASVYTIAQYLGWDPWLPAAAYHVGEGKWTIVRPPATMGHADYLAIFLVYAAFSSAALALAPGARARRVAAFAALLLCSAAVVLSGTRAGILGMCAGAAFLAGRAAPRWRARHTAGAIAGLALVSTAAVWFYHSQAGMQLRARTRWYVEDPWGGGRLLLWRDSLFMAARHPLLGTGPETFTAEFPRYESAALARVVPDSYYESPHNMLLDAAASQGVAGLLLTGGICVLGLAAAWKLSRESPVAAASSAAFLGGLVAQQFASFTVPTALCFYVFAGILAGLSAAGQRAPVAAKATRKPWAAAAGAAALPVFFGLWLIAADVRLAAVPHDMDAGRLSDAAAAFERARDIKFPGFHADLWYSRRMLEAARQPAGQRVAWWRQAREAALRATETAEDRQNAWYNLAEFRAAENDPRGMEDCLRRAIAVAPNWFKPHWSLARLLEAEGRLPEARTEAEAAVSSNGGKDPDVAETLVKIREAKR